MAKSRKKRSALAVTTRGRLAVDLKKHTATRISVFANRMSRAASRFYRERYGIGIVEWRVLLYLGYAGETSANNICRETDLDKGAASRSLNVLEDMGVIRIGADSADNRRRNVVLTAKGRSLHDRIVPAVLERQRNLLAVLSPAEVEKFMEMLGRLQARADRRKPFPARVVSTKIRRASSRTSRRAASPKRAATAAAR
jgi:DNA-binding MarR family transcriptional regulator